MTRAGYVLVGGRSTRMGRDKALLPLHGEPLAAKVAREVAEAAGSATLVGDPGQYGGLGYPVIPDGFPGEGPLGGIVTALRHSQAEWNLIVACDMPELTADFLKALLAAAEEAGGLVTVPRGPSGRLEPMCAVWPRGAGDPVEILFRSGVRKVAAAIGELAAADYAVADLAHFENVNTPEDWTRHAAK